VNIKNTRLQHIVDCFSGKKIAVWGDFILDEYLYGTTRRISREAPVLVLSYKNTDLYLGGAGNALLNLKDLGAVPLPVSVIGNDTAGREIIKRLKSKGINTDYIVIDKDFTTPVKTRILAGEETAKKQQILRIDHEKKVRWTPLLEQKIRTHLENLAARAHALLISDYNYHVVREDMFQAVLPYYKKSNIPVTLDSRFRILNFRSITALTPNEPEVEQALQTEINDNTSELNKIGRTLLKKTTASAVLITRGSKGMALFEKNKPVTYIPIHGTSDIVDVTGAGDTVISVFTLALTCGASFKEAALLSNFAGGLVVMKKGTATLTPEELKEAIVS